jgi:hypothetical protein
VLAYAPINLRALFPISYSILAIDPLITKTMDNADAAFTGDFQFNGFPNFASVMGDASSANFQQPQYPLPQQTSPTVASPTSPVIAQSNNQLDGSSDRSSAPVSTEEAARVAAEEDKRRRNTAASARFRVKKKQREQALENQAKEMTKKAAALEARVSQLELENKWLKSLITEKHENKSEVGELYHKLNNDLENGSRSNPERNDGVGTEKAESTGMKT